MKKTLLRSVVCMIVLCTIWSGAVFGADKQRVFDGAGLLTPSEISTLEEHAAQVSEAVGYDFVVVTTADTGGKTTTAYADDFYDQGGFGTGSEKSGALLLIDMQNRILYISTCGEVIDIMTDARIDAACDSIYNHLAVQEYAQGALTFLSEMQQYCELGVPQDQQRYDTETGEITPNPENPQQNAGTGETIYNEQQSAPTGSLIILSLIVGLAAGGISVAVVVSRYRGSIGKSTYPFRSKSTLNLQVNRETLVNRFVTTRHIPPPDNKNNGGGGGFSSTHTSSGGQTHGGGGRSF